jgi:hypothetical protein
MTIGGAGFLGECAADAANDDQGSKSAGRQPVDLLCCEQRFACMRTFVRDD